MYRDEGIMEHFNHTVAEQLFDNQYASELVLPATHNCEWCSSFKLMCRHAMVRSWKVKIWFWLSMLCEYMVLMLLLLTKLDLMMYGCLVMSSFITYYWVLCSEDWRPHALQCVQGAHGSTTWHRYTVTISQQRHSSFSTSTKDWNIFVAVC